MVRKIIRNLTLDESYLLKYEEILAHNPRLKGNVSLAIREYIKSVVDQEEYQKKLDAQHKIFGQGILNCEASNEDINDILPYIFSDSNRHIRFNEWEQLTLLDFVVKTREASKHAENVYKNRFNESVYLNNLLLLRPKERLSV